jgi:hypothetical protein
LVKQLEVESCDDLNRPSAWILDVRRTGASQEVDAFDVIEGVKELACQLEVNSLDNA